MATATTTVNTSSVYVKLTAAQTGYALIYNPLGNQQVLKIHVGTTVPDTTVDTYMTLQPDEAFQRTSDITDYVWGLYADGTVKKVVVTV